VFNGPLHYRDKKVVGVFAFFSDAPLHPGYEYVVFEIQKRVPLYFFIIVSPI
jgi:hypothetical protein